MSVEKKDYYKVYYENNKDKYTEKIKCELCDTEVNKYGMSAHNKSKKHKLNEAERQLKISKEKEEKILEENKKKEEKYKSIDEAKNEALKYFFDMMINYKKNE